MSTCATCDGFFFRDQDIAVVGGGDSAVEEAIFLTKFARSVTIVHRRDELRASKIMQDRAFANDKIGFAWNRRGRGHRGRHEARGRPPSATRVTGEDAATCPSPGCSWPSATSPTPTCSRASSQLEDSGYLRHPTGGRCTDVEGVFACGDVQDHVYRQAITAAGSGCMAAIDAERWLEAQHDIDRRHGPMPAPPPAASRVPTC